MLFILGPLIGMLLDTPAIDIFDVGKESEVQQSIGLTLGASFLGTLFFLLRLFHLPIYWHEKNLN